MTAVVRPAVRPDIPGMHRVRLAVRENPLTTSVIREEHYVPAIEQSGRGWVVESDGVIVAFAVGNAETGNIWALFVDPAFEGAGYGRRLHDTMTDWLFASGLHRLNLSTGTGTRAQHFYQRAGWRLLEERGGEAFYELVRQGGAIASHVEYSP